MRPMLRRCESDVVVAGTLLGIGLGGFLDGIVFHQILQLHQMLSAVRPPTTLIDAKFNMFWDGIFHAFTWLTTAVGVGMLWTSMARAQQPAALRPFIGSLILGWGVFNFVEGILDHLVLGLHHVVENGNHALWDGLFIASGGAMIALGIGLIARRRSPAPEAQAR